MAKFDKTMKLGVVVSNSDKTYYVYADCQYLQFIEKGIRSWRAKVKKERKVKNNERSKS
jgi:hypothetical protein